jgi:hypothetical protein
VSAATQHLVPPTADVDGIPDVDDRCPVHPAVRGDYSHRPVPGAARRSVSALNL